MSAVGIGRWKLAGPGLPSGAPASWLRSEIGSRMSAAAACCHAGSASQGRHRFGAADSFAGGVAAAVDQKDCFQQFTPADFDLTCGGLRCDSYWDSYAAFGDMRHCPGCGG